MQRERSFWARLVATQDGQLVLVCIPLRRRRKINVVCETGSMFLYLGHICCGSAPGVVQGWRISLQRQLAMRYEARRRADAVLSITLRLSGTGLTALWNVLLQPTCEMQCPFPLFPKAAVKLLSIESCFLFKCIQALRMQWRCQTDGENASWR